RVSGVNGLTMADRRNDAGVRRPAVSGPASFLRLENGGWYLVQAGMRLTQVIALAAAWWGGPLDRAGRPRPAPEAEAGASVRARASAPLSAANRADLSQAQNR